MRASPIVTIVALVPVVLAVVLLGTSGCTPAPTGDTNQDPNVDGIASFEAMPRAIVPGGTAYITVHATDADGDPLTYAYVVDNPALGAISGTGAEVMFVAAEGAPDGSTVTVTVTVSDPSGAIATSTVTVEISTDAGFYVPEGLYIGMETCGRCHGTSFVSRVSGSPHGMSAYVGTRPYAVDASRDWSNVQCEDCHGPGGAHARNPGATNMVVPDMDDSLCGTCHGNGQPAPQAYTEWEGSKHAHALPDLMASGHANATCLNCHSVERIELWQDVTLPEVAAAALTNDPLPAVNGITCVVCHSPHRATTRDPESSDPWGIASICMECHTGGVLKTGSTPHHATTEFLTGPSGFDRNGNPLLDNPPSHRGVKDLCVACHYNSSETVTGHTALPQLEAADSMCRNCHPSWDLTARVDARETEVRERVAELKALYPTIAVTPGSPEDDLFQKAKFNIGLEEAEGSWGVHAPENTDALLDAAESILESLAP